MGRDIVVHYDEEAREITCSSVDASLTAPLLAHGLPMTTSISFLAKKGADEAERSFGAAILALIDLHAHKKTGLRDYEALAKRWTEERAQAEQSEQRVTSTFDAVLELISKGLSEKSRSTMDSADRLLRAAAEVGDPEAKDFLENQWPVLKARSDKTFK